MHVEVLFSLFQHGGSTPPTSTFNLENISRFINIAELDLSKKSEELVSFIAFKPINQNNS